MLGGVARHPPVLIGKGKEMAKKKATRRTPKAKAKAEAPPISEERMKRASAMGQAEAGEIRALQGGNMKLPGNMTFGDVPEGDEDAAQLQRILPRLSTVQLGPMCKLLRVPIHPSNKTTCQRVLQAFAQADKGKRNRILREIPPILLATAHK